MVNKDLLWPHVAFHLLPPPLPLPSLVFLPHSQAFPHLFVVQPKSCGEESGNEAGSVVRCALHSYISPDPSGFLGATVGALFLSEHWPASGAGRFTMTGHEDLPLC